GGSAIVNVATVVSRTESDPVATDDVDSVRIVVQSADLAVSLGVDHPAPIEGDVVRYQVTLANAGPDPATGIRLIDPVPAGLGYRSGVANHGSYAAATGIWTIDSLAAGAADTLVLEA